MKKNMVLVKKIKGYKIYKDTSKENALVIESPITFTPNWVTVYNRSKEVDYDSPYLVPNFVKDWMDSIGYRYGLSPIAYKEGEDIAILDIYHNPSSNVLVKVGNSLPKWKKLYRSKGDSFYFRETYYFNLKGKKHYLLDFIRV